MYIDVGKQGGSDMILYEKDRLYIITYFQVLEAEMLSILCCNEWSMNDLGI